MKILLVDDDEIALELLEISLVSQGHQVVKASNGYEALDTLASESIQFVITDWDMPVMDGLTLCRSIRRHTTTGYIYVILLTCYDREQEIIEGMSAGADDFITKPFNQHELAERVKAGERVLSLETRDMLIFALAKLAESRDQDTGMHLERVQRYSRRLAEALAEVPQVGEQVDSDFIRLVYQTSPLHDIGKVGIPDSVLLKPSRLSYEEYEIMKTHAEIGARTLNETLSNYPQAKFLEMARDIAYAHHEYWDGSGYPRGLKGIEIPLSARIVTVADVYDALTTRRVYKDAYTHEKARQMIEEDSGTHFDPLIVSTFLRIEDDFIDIASRFTDSPKEAEDMTARLT